VSNVTKPLAKSRVFCHSSGVSSLSHADPDALTARKNRQKHLRAVFRSLDPMPSEQILRGAGFDSADLLPLLDAGCAYVMSDARLDALEAFIRQRRGAPVIEKALESGFCPEHTRDPLDVAAPAPTGDRMAEIADRLPELPPKRKPGRPPAPRAVPVPIPVPLASTPLIWPEGCNNRLRAEGKAYPRTCAVCGLFGRCHASTEHVHFAAPETEAPKVPEAPKTQSASILLSTGGRVFAFSGPVAITRAELERISAWLATQFIVEP
jgi:hypothetical protein